MMGVPNTLFGLSHAIGHALGIVYGVPHGYTSCVMQPHVMKYNRLASAAKQASFARAIGLDTRGMSDEAAAVEGARAVARLIQELRLPSRIRELDIPREALPGTGGARGAEQLCEGQRHPRHASDQALEVLTRAW